MSLVHSPMQLYIMRLLLGAAEAGFTPGIIYYLSCWYPRSDRARAMSFFYIGATLASVIGLPLSGLLLKLNGVMGISGWRWLFLLEGLPALLLGFVVLSYLPDAPAKAPWLSDTQKDWLIGLLRREADSSPVAHSTAWQKALRNRKVWMLSLFWFLQAFGTLRGHAVPAVDRALGVFAKRFDRHAALCAAVSVRLRLHVSQRPPFRSFRRARAGISGIPMLGAGSLLIAAIYCGNQTLSYALLVVTIALNWAATPVFWAVTTVAPVRHRSGGFHRADQRHREHLRRRLAAVDGYIKDTTNTYDYALLLVAAALLGGGVLGLYLGGARQKSA